MLERFVQRVEILSACLKKRSKLRLFKNRSTLGGGGGGGGGGGKKKKGHPLPKSSINFISLCEYCLIQSLNRIFRGNIRLYSQIIVLVKEISK